MNKTLAGNMLDRNPKWYWEIYLHPTVWIFGFQVVFRWDDIYSLGILCLTLHFSKNEFYADKSNVD